MCRMVVFGGTCVRCGEYYTVSELEQKVSCLEAKNNGRFGHCGKGVMMDEHDPSFECVACGSSEDNNDNNNSHHNNGNDDILIPVGDSPGASSNSSSGSSNRGHHHSHRHHHSSSKSKSSKGSSSSSSGGSYDPIKRRRVR